VSANLLRGIYRHKSTVECRTKRHSGHYEAY